MSKVMIVDDSEAMRKNLRHILITLGYEIICEATNGKEAYLLYQKYRPDIVTMDISMPTADGITAVKMIIDDYPKANIIMISALGQKSMVYEALKSGAKDYIVKPIEQDKLKNILNKLCVNFIDDLDSSNDGNAKQDQNSFQPFYIENKAAGKFLIKIKSSLDLCSLPHLNNILNGIKFITPLEVTFDFEDPSRINTDIITKIYEIADKINCSGEKAILLTNGEFIDSTNLL